MKLLKYLSTCFYIFFIPFQVSFAESLYELPLNIHSEEGQPEVKTRFLFEVMNDFLTTDMTDRYFTSGIRVGQISNKLPRFLEWYSSEDLKDDYYVVTLTQEIYTPEDIEETELIENDRPYAGWTYVTFAIGKRDHNTLGLTVLDIGALGEGSQAEKTQIGFHKATGSTIPSGWEHQLGSELGVMLKHIRAKNFRVEKESFSADLSVFAGGAIGNVRTSLDAGLNVRFGYNVPNSIMIGHEYEKQKEFSLYAHMGVHSSYIFRNALLDGNTFSDSHSVEREPFVNRYTLGVAADLGNYRLSYTYDIFGREFKQQRERHHLGTLNLSYFKKFRLY